VFSHVKASNHSYLTSPSEVISTMSDKIEFSPAIPWPEPFDVQKRIKELLSYLDPKNPLYRSKQVVNIKAVIQLYEDGIIDGSEEVWVMEGKVVTEEETLKGGHAWAWLEVHSFKSLPRIHLTNRFKLQGMEYQFAEKHAYGHRTFRDYHEVRNQAVF
jgi:hypothetical protein